MVKESQCLKYKDHLNLLLGKWTASQRGRNQYINWDPRSRKGGHKGCATTVLFNMVYWYIQPGYIYGVASHPPGNWKNYQIYCELGKEDCHPQTRHLPFFTCFQCSVVYAQVYQYICYVGKKQKEWHQLLLLVSVRFRKPKSLAVDIFNPTLLSSCISEITVHVAGTQAIISLHFTVCSCVGGISMHLSLCLGVQYSAVTRNVLEPKLL